MTTTSPTTTKSMNTDENVPRSEHRRGGYPCEDGEMTSWGSFLIRVRSYETIMTLLDLDDLMQTAEELIDSVRALGLPDSIIRYDTRFGVIEVKYPDYARRMEDLRFATRMSVSVSVARLGAGSVCNVIDMRSRRKTDANSEKGKFWE